MTFPPNVIHQFGDTVKWVANADMRSESYITTGKEYVGTVLESLSNRTRVKVINDIGEERIHVHGYDSFSGGFYTITPCVPTDEQKKRKLAYMDLLIKQADEEHAVRITELHGKRELIKLG